MGDAGGRVGAAGGAVELHMMLGRILDLRSEAANISNGWEVVAQQLQKRLQGDGGAVMLLNVEHEFVCGARREELTRVVDTLADRAAAVAVLAHGGASPVRAMWVLRVLALHFPGAVAQALKGDRLARMLAAVASADPGALMRDAEDLRRQRDLDRHASLAKGKSSHGASGPSTPTPSDQRGAAAAKSAARAKDALPARLALLACEALCVLQGLLSAPRREDHILLPPAMRDAVGAIRDRFVHLRRAQSVPAAYAREVARSGWCAAEGDDGGWLPGLLATAACMHFPGDTAGQVAGVVSPHHASAMWDVALRVGRVHLPVEDVPVYLASRAVVSAAATVLPHFPARVGRFYAAGVTRDPAQRPTAMLHASLTAFLAKMLMLPARDTLSTVVLLAAVAFSDPRGGGGPPPTLPSGPRSSLGGSGSCVADPVALSRSPSPSLPQPPPPQRRRLRSMTHGPSSMPPRTAASPAPSGESWSPSPVGRAACPHRGASGTPFPTDASGGGTSASTATESAASPPPAAGKKQRRWSVVNMIGSLLSSKPQDTPLSPQPPPSLASPPGSRGKAGAAGALAAFDMDAWRAGGGVVHANFFGGAFELVESAVRGEVAGVGSRGHTAHPADARDVIADNVHTAAAAMAVDRRTSAASTTANTSPPAQSLHPAAGASKAVVHTPPTLWQQPPTPELGAGVSPRRAEPLVSCAEVSSPTTAEPRALSVSADIDVSFGESSPSVSPVREARDAGLATGPVGCVGLRGRMTPPPTPAPAPDDDDDTRSPVRGTATRRNSTASESPSASVGGGSERVRDTTLGESVTLPGGSDGVAGPLALMHDAEATLVFAVGAVAFSHGDDLFGTRQAGLLDSVVASIEAELPGDDRRVLRRRLRLQELDLHCNHRRLSALGPDGPFPTAPSPVDFGMTGLGVPSSPPARSLPGGGGTAAGPTGCSMPATFAFAAAPLRVQVAWLLLLRARMRVGGEGGYARVVPGYFHREVVGSDYPRRPWLVNDAMCIALLSVVRRHYAVVHAYDGTAFPAAAAAVGCGETPRAPTDGSRSPRGGGGVCPTAVPHLSFPFLCYLTGVSAHGGVFGAVADDDGPTANTPHDAGPRRSAADDGGDDVHACMVVHAALDIVLHMAETAESAASSEGHSAAGVPVCFAEPAFFPARALAAVAANTRSAPVAAALAARLVVVVDGMQRRHRDEVAAAVCIQRAYRAARRRAHIAVRVDRRRRCGAAVAIQRTARGWCVRVRWRAGVVAARDALKRAEATGRGEVVAVECAARDRIARLRALQVPLLLAQEAHARGVLEQLSAMQHAEITRRARLETGMLAALGAYGHRAVWGEGAPAVPDAPNDIDFIADGEGSTPGSGDATGCHAGGADDVFYLSRMVALRERQSVRVLCAVLRHEAAAWRDLRAAHDAGIRRVAAAAQHRRQRLALLRQSHTVAARIARAEDVAWHAIRLERSFPTLFLDEADARWACAAAQAAARSALVAAHCDALERRARRAVQRRWREALRRCVVLWNAAPVVNAAVAAVLQAVATAVAAPTIHEQREALAPEEGGEPQQPRTRYIAIGHPRHAATGSGRAAAVAARHRAEADRAKERRVHPAGAGARGRRERGKAAMAAAAAERKEAGGASPVAPGTARDGGGGGDADGEWALTARGAEEADVCGGVSRWGSTRDVGGRRECPRPRVLVQEESPQHADSATSFGCTNERRTETGSVPGSPSGSSPVGNGSPLLAYRALRTPQGVALTQLSPRAQLRALLAAAAQRHTGDPVPRRHSLVAPAPLQGPLLRRRATPADPHDPH